MSDELIKTFVEVELRDSEAFLLILESLTRIGVTASAEKKLYQTCHLLHKRGRYYLVHFKEMLALDGNKTNFSLEDKQRRNRIANLLEQWKLLKVIDKTQTQDQCAMSKVKVIPYSEKRQYELVPKYRVGSK